MLPTLQIVIQNRMYGCRYVFDLLDAEALNFVGMPFRFEYALKIGFFNCARDNLVDFAYPPLFRICGRYRRLERSYCN